ncbi:MAG TPA: hypothetical protein VMN78_07700 [Longimicrobiales bacterium]|nr:hypothetical protein [Longimicrobiales bacterium]
MNRVHLFVVPLLAIGCAGAAERVTPAPAPAPAQVEIQTLIDELYAVISGPAGQERDWARMRELFAPGARLSPMVRQLPSDSLATGPRPAMMILTVEDYIERAGPMLMRDGFFETEIHSVMERYGNVAHVWSTYESRIVSPDSEPVDRGINSIQLVYGEGRWWVYSILWHSERAGAGSIPADYLP